MLNKNEYKGNNKSFKNAIKKNYQLYKNYLNRKIFQEELIYKTYKKNFKQF